MSYVRTENHRQKMRLAKANTVKYWKSGGEFKKGAIPWNKGVTHSEATKIKIGLKSKGRHVGIGAYGENNPAWRGGYTPIRKRIRESLAYRQWRDAVFKRDGHTCQKCKKRGGILQGDHFPHTFAWLIRKFKVDSMQKAIVTKELWKLEGGRTLCIECHRKTPTYAKHL